MVASYSQDLRKRAVDLVMHGKKTRANVGKIFTVHPTTIGRWIRLLKQTGSLKPKEVKRRRSDKYVGDKEMIRFIEENKNSILKQMQHNYKKKFGIELSYVAIYDKIKKLNYSYKKNSGYTKRDATSNV